MAKYDFFLQKLPLTDANLLKKNIKSWFTIYWPVRLISKKRRGYLKKVLNNQLSIVKELSARVFGFGFFRKSAPDKTLVSR
jgi:hypothetical protein